MSFRNRLGFIITGSEAVLGSLMKDTIVETIGVVFGLNKPSVYVKGQIAPSKETLLHSGIYEALPEIHAIFRAHDSTVLKVSDKLSLPSTDKECPAGSQELAEEVVAFINLNKSVRYFIIKNYGVISLGATMAEAGKLMDEMHAKALSVDGKKSK